MQFTFISGTEGRAFTTTQARPFAAAQASLTLLGVLASVPMWLALGLIR